MSSLSLSLSLGHYHRTAHPRCIVILLQTQTIKMVATALVGSKAPTRTMCKANSTAQARFAPAVVRTMPLMASRACGRVMCQVRWHAHGYSWRMARPVGSTPVLSLPRAAALPVLFSSVGEADDRAIILAFVHILQAVNVNAAASASEKCSYETMVVLRVRGNSASPSDRRTSPWLSVAFRGFPWLSVTRSSAPRSHSRCSPSHFPAGSHRRAAR